MQKCFQILSLIILFANSPARADDVAPAELTVERPVRVSLTAERSILTPGSRSFLFLNLEVPEGFWIGAAEGNVRSPGPTRLELEKDSCVRFGEPLWPEARVEGIPVKLGTTRVYKGRIKVVIPIEVSGKCAEGEHRLAARLTYTPGLNAGHLTPHIRERYETRVRVAGAAVAAAALESGAPIPRPETGSAAGLKVQRQEVSLPGPLEKVFFGLSEESALASALHKVWQDPPDHGKQVRAIAHPVASTSKNEGSSAGVGFGFVNTTAEGIGTAAVNLRLLDNEYLGATAEFDLLSCPAAFHNFWLSGFVSDEGSYGASLHLENLTRADGKRGYEIQLDAFDDGRFRFFGLGSETREEGESAYAHREFGGAIDFFWNVAPNWRVSAGARLRDVDLDEPAEELGEEEASTLERFPEVRGIGGGSIASERVSVIFDRRNQEFTPSRGTFARLRGEFNHTLDENDEDLASSWGKFEALVRQYWSSPGQRYTLVARNEWQLTTGEDDLPFWAQPTLGGAANLRAFGEGRFYGQNSVFASLELRIQTLHMVMLGMPLDLELAPFIDIGQVFDDSLGGRFNADPGVSMRILNRPNIGAVINWAHGQDGNRFTGGVSLPF